MGYLTRTSNYLKRITLYDPTHMRGMDDLMAISVETSRVDGGCYFEKEFIELIYMKP